MNERIAILMNQARAQYRNQDLPYEQGLVEYSEKFAELILKDLLCSMSNRYGEDDELPIQEIKLFIKEHFGVE
jgi:hypothetical protein